MDELTFNVRLYDYLVMSESIKKEALSYKTKCSLITMASNRFISLHFGVGKRNKAAFFYKAVKR